MRGATRRYLRNRFYQRYFNPRTPCGVRPSAADQISPCRRISIHAPRAGCDGAAYLNDAPSIISIHAPRAGCDGLDLHELRGGRNFNPRTPCGVRRFTVTDISTLNGNFNPRTPCGVRRCYSRSRNRRTGFQSTHPVRGATWQRKEGDGLMGISIHAPRAGCDWAGVSNPIRRDISIHAPRAGCDRENGMSFQQIADISIHAPRAGCDGVCDWRQYYGRRFQSTHPVRGATWVSGKNECESWISIHAPRAGCDVVANGTELRNAVFQSTHPVRGATKRSISFWSIMVFQSTHPVRGATS